MKTIRYKTVSALLKAHPTAVSHKCFAKEEAARRQCKESAVLMWLNRGKYNHMTKLKVNRRVVFYLV